MSLRISIVPYGSLTQVLGGLYGYLQTAAEWSRGRSNADDIVRACYTNAYQMWVVHDDDRLYGFFTTEVKQYPQMKMMCVQHCVIEPNHMSAVENEMQEIAKRYAEHNGCSGIEFAGRPGWKRHAAKYGYHKQSVVYQRFFDKEQT